SPATLTSKPAWRRLIAISSAIAGSSSTTRIRLMCPGLPSANHGLDHPHRIVANVGPLDDVDDLLGEVLGVVADTLDRLGDEDQVDARRDRPRVLHHEGDELAQQALELLVAEIVALEDVEGAVDVEPRERVERLAQLPDRELRLVGEV